MFRIITAFLLSIAFCHSLLIGNQKLSDLQEQPNKSSTMSDTKEAPVVVLETTQGVIEVTLKPKVAPKATENFVKHVEEHYYDGLTFHRIIKNFMIQGGDPNGNGTGGKSIWGAPFEDEFSVDVKFDKPGLFAMANRGPNTNGSQFFITTVPTDWLNGKHTIFGEVTKGMDVVKKLETVKTDGSSKPVETQKIIKAYIKN